MKQRGSHHRNEWQGDGAQCNMSNGEKAGFWHTLPGILTGVAAVIGAVGGLIGVLYTCCMGPDDNGNGREPASPPPEIVIIQTVEDTAVAHQTGVEVRGEELTCASSLVVCATVSVLVPSNANIVSVERAARNVGSGAWSTSPYGGIGTADWVGDVRTEDAGNGMTRYSATLKNWNDSTARELRITVSYEEEQPAS